MMKYKQNYFQHISDQHEQLQLLQQKDMQELLVRLEFNSNLGPGFTNAVTGLADWYLDSIPLVVISGQVPTTIIGSDGFQEIDAVRIQDLVQNTII